MVGSRIITTIPALGEAGGGATLMVWSQSGKKARGLRRLMRAMRYKRGEHELALGVLDMAGNVQEWTGSG